jgi:hypothetical protein
MLALMIVGGLVFQWGYASGILIGINEGEERIFIGFLYAVSEFLPFGSSLYSNGWYIDLRETFGVALFISRVFFEFLGIVFTALAGIGFSGLMEGKWP